jgi:hypothetical protein
MNVFNDYITNYKYWSNSYIFNLNFANLTYFTMSRSQIIRGAVSRNLRAYEDKENIDVSKYAK